MKPRLKLHLDMTVSLAAAPELYRYHFQKPRLYRFSVVAKMRQCFGSVSGFQRTAGIRPAILQTALDDGHNKANAMGGTSGALRAMLGLPVCSSVSTKPLDTTLRVPLAAIAAIRERQE